MGIDTRESVVPGVREGKLSTRIVESTGVPPPLARALEQELRRRIQGEVHFDPGYRALYATDGSNYRMPPIGVALPKTPDDVTEIVAACRRFGVPILSRGGGTSLSGETCNAAVIIDHSKWLRTIVELDPVHRRARVQPGVVLDDLRSAANAHGLTFAPDPSTHRYCTLGGMLGNNSCGRHSLMAGRTADNVETLEVLTYDGQRLRVGATSLEDLKRIQEAGGRRAEIYDRLGHIADRYGAQIRARFPKIPRLVSGYALDQLLPEHGFHVARSLVGTEGTCVTVLEATLRLVPWPKSRVLLVLGFDDIFRAGDRVPELLGFGAIALEGFDDVLAQDIREHHLHPKYLKLLPKGHSWLFLEFGGDNRDEAIAHARRLEAHLKANPGAPSVVLYPDREEQQHLWNAREAGLGATSRVQGQHDAWPGWEDSAVHPDRLGEYLRGLRKLYDKYGYHAALYGHFGQGCVHTRIDFELETPRGVARHHAFIDEASSLCVKLGGSLSGEHGDGQARAEFLEKMFGRELMEAFREFKAVWDPGDKLNPNKLITARGARPYSTTENLRMGPHWNPAHPSTHFHYPDDEGDLTRASTRCVGVGKCRSEHVQEGSVMCPSYMATRDERDSTRGRAHALFEMLTGTIDEAGWKSEGVKRALDLCLSCKGCKQDCPMRVDMATYKAEFLSHHYAGRVRPREAYAMGLIAWWARAAELSPRLANAFTQTPGVRRVFKWLGGVAPEREVPPFAPRTFQELFAARPEAPRMGRQVILWPDTFSDHFHPEVPMAAVDVLEAAGFSVRLPSLRLCCGRPLYDYGMLDTAKRWLRRTLDGLGDAIDAGVPIVGVEPSCIAVFRDEVRNLFPEDARAKRLAEQSWLLSEFLKAQAPDFELPSVPRDALVQKHCHHHAVLRFGDEQETMKKMGLRAHVLDSGCCGLAGSFGFERRHHALSMQIGERGLFPGLRQSPDALVIADGFSCRTQIAQGTRREAHHLAEVLRDGLADAGRLRTGAWTQLPPRPLVPRWAWGLAAALALVAVARQALA
ncbi:MAG: FAD-binding protein [Deltaproteobacteria bacterium]|nr:FAD-binding protein [Deltaproteobacteria bacterium]